MQAPQTRQEMPSTAFPTYYTVRWCEGDGSWRVVYDVFFQKVRVSAPVESGQDVMMGFLCDGMDKC